MTQLPNVYRTLRERFDASRADRRTRSVLTFGAIAVSFGLTASLSLAPPAPPSQAAALAAYATENAQEVDVSASATTEHLVASGAVTRDAYEATDGEETYISGGTNYDWAKLVLLYAGFPVSDSNVVVFVRWMRQENYTDSWWNRNNPLNNGWGASYGPGGTGSNIDLVAAARNAADALRSHAGYAGIVAAFEASVDSATVEQAIWDSPWASGHYGGGTRWHRSEVPVVSAPASAWGR